MNIIIERRAQIALRSLAQNEQKQILKALAQIESVKPQNLVTISNLKKMRTELSKNTYLYRGNQRLSLVLSFKDNVVIVEDIVAHDKIDRLMPNLSKQ
ncbi:MAG: hypothetical protein ACRC80_39450 [Waterburya sp.]